MMASNLTYIVARERRRASSLGSAAAGKVLAFAHNYHLKCGQAEWQFGPQLVAWWPAGAHLRQMLGARYAVIGPGVAVSQRHEIGPPEPGTLEACLSKVPGPGRWIATPRTGGLPAAAI